MAGESRWTRVLGLAATGVLGAGVIAGCGGSTHHTASAATRPAHTTSEAEVTTQGAVAPNGTPLPKVSTPGTPKGEQTVPLLVIATPGAQKRTAFALIPVYIDGRGPFPFALDTGASRSLIAASLATLLHLPNRGPAGTLYGIVGGAKAENVMVSNWRAGKVALPSEVVATLAASPGAQSSSATTGQSHGPMGLLGSDVLSRYGKIAVDYNKGYLILDPPVK